MILRKSYKIVIISFLGYFIFFSCVCFCHPGGTDSKGCHRCKTNCIKWGLSNGEYHCHNAKLTSEQSEKNKKSVSLANKSVRQVAKVVDVVDGDTIDVLIDEKKERVRLIGINTPETKDPRKPVQCFGEEASQKAKCQLPKGKLITLENDPTQSNRDKYERLLRYVWIDDKNFNYIMIREGFAFEYTYNLPYKYQSLFKDAQKMAEKERLGLWSESACNGKLIPK